MTSEEIVRLRISNEPENVGDPIDKGTLSTLDSDIKRLISAIQSATEKGGFVGTSRRVLDSNSGQAYQDVFVRKQDLASIEEAFINMRSSLRSSAHYAIDTSGVANLVTGTMQLHGASARKVAQQEAMNIGGQIIHRPTATRADNYDFMIPVDTSVTDVRSFVSTSFSGSSSLSSSELRRRNTLDKEKQTEANEKKQLKDIERQKKEEEANKIAIEKELSRAEEKAKRDEEKQRKVEEKEDKESKRVVKGALVKILAGITVLADITRRILSSVLVRTSQAVEDTIRAGTVGITYQQSRGNTIKELAFGLTKGTINGSLTDIQTKFGNKENLDTEALEKLAIVMGGDVKDLVASGAYAKRPDELRRLILNKYFDTAMKGKNSLGEYVGVEDAIINLNSQLSGVSPYLAEQFATMSSLATNPNSLYFGKFNTIEELEKLVNTNRMGLNGTDFGVSYTSGEYIKQISSIAEDLKSGISVKLSADIMRILERIANSRVGMSEEEKRRLQQLNIEANNRTIKELSDDADIYNNAVTQAMGFRFNTYRTKFTEKMTPTQIALASRGRLSDEEFDALGIPKASRAQAKQDALKFYQALMQDPSTRAEMSYATSIANALYSLKKENAKKGNIDALFYGGDVIAKGASDLAYSATLDSIMFNSASDSSIVSNALAPYYYSGIEADKLTWSNLLSIPSIKKVWDTKSAELSNLGSTPLERARAYYKSTLGSVPTSVLGNLMDSFSDEYDTDEKAQRYLDNILLSAIVPAYKQAYRNANTSQKYASGMSQYQMSAIQATSGIYAETERRNVSKGLNSKGELIVTVKAEEGTKATVTSPNLTETSSDSNKTQYVQNLD